MNYGHSPAVDEAVTTVHSFMLVVAPVVVNIVPANMVAETTLNISKQLAAQLDQFRSETLQAAGKIP